MLKPFKIQARNALKVAIAFTPWLISMYALYWLEYGEIWSIETPHRGKMSVAILLVGMGLSFLVQSRFATPPSNTN
jgi:hypothetical protein